MTVRPAPAEDGAGRVLQTRAIAAWLGRERELAALPQSERDAIAARWVQARGEGRREETEIIAGQDCGLIRELLPAAAVVRRIVMEAEGILGRFATDRASRGTVG